MSSPFYLSMLLIPPQHHKLQLQDVEQQTTRRVIKMVMFTCKDLQQRRRRKSVSSKNIGDPEMMSRTLISTRITTSHHRSESEFFLPNYYAVQIDNNVLRIHVLPRDGRSINRCQKLWMDYIDFCICIYWYLVVLCMYL